MISRQTFYNFMMKMFDPEVRIIKKLILHNNCNLADQNNISIECEQVFVQRLKKFPRALKMSFWENHFELDSFKDYPEIRGRILDFGCGSGHLDLFLARRGMVVHGIDLSCIGISIAKYIRGQESSDVRERLSFSIADVAKDLPNGELYDSAWSAHVFEHIDKPGGVLAGLRNWIKPGGYLLISVPLGLAYDDPGHVNHFHDGEQLRSYLKNYITIERIDISIEFQVIRALCKFDV